MPRQRRTPLSQHSTVSSGFIILAVISLAMSGCISGPKTHITNARPAIWPISHPSMQVTSEFGMRKDPFTGKPKQHNGIDIAAPRKTPVQATASGEVIVSGTWRGYGKIIQIDHGNGIQTWYGHLHSRKVSKGDRVKCGQRIGKLGKTGRATGPHLQYEVRLHGKPVNPRRYLP